MTHAHAFTFSLLASFIAAFLPAPLGEFLVPWLFCVIHLLHLLSFYQSSVGHSIHFDIHFVKSSDPNFRSFTNLPKYFRPFRKNLKVTGVSPIWWLHGLSVT